MSLQERLNDAHRAAAGLVVFTHRGDYIAATQLLMAVFGDSLTTEHINFVGALAQMAAGYAEDAAEAIGLSPEDLLSTYARELA